MKIKRKYLPAATGVCMGSSMGVVMSLVMTLVNVGLVQGFFSKRMKAFVIGASVDISLGIMIVPFVGRQLKKIAVD